MQYECSKATLRFSFWLLQLVLSLAFSGVNSFSCLGSDDEWSQIAYVAFKDAEEVEAAALLSVSK